MSPLLFVILLGLLAGLVLFALVIGVGALLSALLSKRQVRREANAGQPQPADEFDSVLSGQSEAEAESSVLDSSKEATFATSRRSERAQASSLVQNGEGQLLVALEDEQPAGTELKAPELRKATKFPALRRQEVSKGAAAAAESELEATGVAKAQADAEPRVPVVSATVTAELIEDVASDDQDGSKIHTRRTELPVEAAVEEPAALTEPATTTAASQRGGLLQKRTVAPTPAPAVETMISEPKESPATPKPAPEDPFAAVLAAVNKR